VLPSVLVPIDVFICIISQNLHRICTLWVMDSNHGYLHFLALELYANVVPVTSLGRAYCNVGRLEPAEKQKLIGPSQASRELVLRELVGSPI
jgi:hypothetical protein